MMGDDRLCEPAKPVEFLDVYLGDNLRPHPGVHLRETGDRQDPLQPWGEQTWPSYSPDSVRQDAYPGASSPEPMHLGIGPSQDEARQQSESSRSPRDSQPLGSPRQSQSTSTQVVFWAGILQAQMCVLDLEEELEKTEGLRAELRCCLPTAPTDLPAFPSSPVAPQDPGPAVDMDVDEDEALGEDGSRPEGDDQNPGWLREGTPDSSPEWGAEEESLFFDNPLFLESPCSDTSASETHFSWGFSDCCADVTTGPQSPQSPELPPPGGRVPWQLGSETDPEDTENPGGPTTPPFPVPIYRLHTSAWATVDAATEGIPTAPSSQRESEAPLEDSLDLIQSAASCEDKALTWEIGQVGSDSSTTPNPVQPWALPSPEGWQREEVPSWPLEPLSSQDRGDRDAECPQGSAPCTETPGSWGSPASSLEPSSPESEGRGPGPQPSPVSSGKGSPQLRSHQPGSELPKWALDASSPSLLETDGAEPHSLETEEAGGTLNLGKEVKSEGPARTAEAGAVQPDVRLTSPEGLPESPMPQALLPEEGLGPQAGDKLANGIRNDKMAWNLASRLYHLEGFRKSEVAAFLRKNDFSRAVAEEYLSFFQFGGQSLEKLEWAVDEEDAATPEKARPSPPAGKMSNPFLQLAQDPTVPTYKQGILARKMHQDADGKKTPWGKRGWKMIHTLLRGMVLYFLKGEDLRLEGESLVGQMVDEPVGVHHSLATPATHYTKKPHVFQLRTADWRLYLFQAPTAQEMTSWIARINLAAATHSAPPFPAAVGSQRRFVRPILPMGPAQSSLEEQHRSHENCLDAASDDLLDLQRNLPERRGRSRELEDYRLRKEYLEYEKTRYETYVELLVARLRCPADSLDLWEEQLGREAAGTQEPKPSLKKSHSSPSLHQDEAPTTAKVKRNISERRTYRKIIPKRNRNQL
uniref:Pleckstrin and Sec7 domain containing 4 n=1 Tax=Sus scrofa TaxID=9823 RepID=A0A8D2A1Q7_PIG